MGNEDLRHLAAVNAGRTFTGNAQIDQDLWRDAYDAELIRLARGLPEPAYQGDGVTVYTGDALHVLPHLGDVSAVVTDPPYSSGGAFRGDRTLSTVAKYVRSDCATYRPEFAGDTRDQRGYLAWSTLWLTAARYASRPGALVVVFTDWRQLPVTTDAVQAAGWIWRGIAPWSKGWGRPRLGGFSSACEFLVWGTNGALVPGEGRTAPGWFLEPPAVKKHHIAEKPERVLRWLLSLVEPGGLVLDPFMGGGTTLVAARSLGLRGVGVELDPVNCALAVQRLAQGDLFAFPESAEAGHELEPVDDGPVWPEDEDTYGGGARE